MALDMNKRRRKRVLGKKLPPEVKKRATVAAEENERNRHARSEEKLRESLRQVGGPVEEVVKEVKNPFKQGGIVYTPPKWTRQGTTYSAPQYSTRTDNVTFPSPGETAGTDLSGSSGYYSRSSF